MAIAVEDLKRLSPRNRVLIIGGTYLLTVYFFYTLLLQDRILRQAELSAKLAELSSQVEEKQVAAARFGKYNREVNELKAQYQLALLKLPNKKEIPVLLDALARCGKQAGIEFILFEPLAAAKAPESNPPGKQPPADKDKGKVASSQAEEKFYDEIPIKVSFRGSYHNTARFFEMVAKLPRIVNIEDINIGDAKAVPHKGLILTTTCVIKTYIFVDKKAEPKTKDEKPA